MSNPLFNIAPHVVDGVQDNGPVPLAEVPGRHLRHAEAPGHSGPQPQIIQLLIISAVQFSKDQCQVRKYADSDIFV